MTADTTAAVPPTAGKATLLIIFLTVFIDLLGFGIVLPLLPRYAATLRATDLQLGLLMASFSAMQFLFAPFWGSLSDRIGRRPVLMLGLLGSTLAYTLFGYVSSLGSDGTLIGFGPLAWLFLTRIGAGIAGATIPTAQAVIADCTTPATRGRGMALIGAAFGIGFTFGPLIGAACVWDETGLALTRGQADVIANWSVSGDLVSADLLIEVLEKNGPVTPATREAIVALLPSPRDVETLKAELLKPPSGLPGYIAGSLSAVALVLAAFRLKESRRPDSAAAVHRGFRPGLVLQHLKTPGLSLILPATFITTFGFAQFESTLSLLTQHFGYDTRWNFLLYAYVGFVLSIGQGVLVRRLLPRIGERRMALIGTFLMTIGFGLVAATGAEMLPPTALWFILPVIVIGFSAVTPSLSSLLSQAAGKDEQGAVLGTGQSLSSLARILGPWLGIQLLGSSVSLPYVLGAVLILCGGVLITRLTVRSTG